MKLDNKVIIVTGGAGFLGSLFCELILKFGGRPIILDNNQILLQKEIKRIKRKYKKKILGFCVDISNEKKIAEIKIKILKKYKKIDGLVNNAALNPDVNFLKKNDCSLEEYPMEFFQKEFDVGLKGALICTKIFGKYFSKKKNGNIINISSDLGIISPTQHIYESKKSKKKQVKPVSYSIIKSGIIGLTKYTSTYWANNNVRCNAIAPGGVYNFQNKTFLKKISKLIPMKRLGKKEEVGYLLIFLLSDFSSYINGAVISVDGGRTAW